MCHHHIYSREIRDGVLGDRFGAWSALVVGIVAVLVALVREGPVARFGLVGGCVDQRFINKVLELSKPGKTEGVGNGELKHAFSLAPFFNVNECTPSSRYVTPAALALSPIHISLALSGNVSSGSFGLRICCPFLV